MAEQHGERRTFNFLLFENCPCIRFHPLVVFRGTLFLLRISLLQWHGRRWCHMLTWSLEQSFWQEGRCIIGIAFSMDEVARYDRARVDRDRNQVRIRESVGLRIEKKKSYINFTQFIQCKHRGVTNSKQFIKSENEKHDWNNIQLINF